MYLLGMVNMIKLLSYIFIGVSLILLWMASFRFTKKKQIHLALSITTVIFIGSLCLSICTYEQWKQFQIEQWTQQYPRAELVFEPYYKTPEAGIWYYAGAILTIAWINYNRKKAILK